jgi:hypothetical protein
MDNKPFLMVSPEFRAAFDEAVRRALSGQRDPEAMKQACEHMDSFREEMRRQQGVLNIGVDLIRALRGELPEP